MDLKITPSGQTIVKPTALGPVANTDTKLLIYGLFQKGRVLAQDGVGDTTEFVIGSGGKLYLAALLDLYSRFLVGWAVSAINDRHLVIKALRMALKRRQPAAGLLHHSDQGSPYASKDYQRLLETHGMTGSMSRRGNCYDNAVIESWFSTVKHELGEHFLSCGEAKMALFDFIEVFYNQRRRHSTLGQVSPAEFERWVMTSPA